MLKILFRFVLLWTFECRAVFGSEKWWLQILQMSSANLHYSNFSCAAYALEFCQKGGCLCLEWCHAKGSHMKPWRSMTRGVGGSKNPNLAWRNNWKAPFIILSFSINTIFSLAILFENKGSSFFHNDLFSLISHQDSHSIRVLHTCSVWFTNRFRCWRYLYKSASFLVFANLFFQSGTWHNCLLYVFDICGLLLPQMMTVLKGECFQWCV